MKTVGLRQLTEEDKKLEGKAYHTGIWYYITIGKDIIPGGPFTEERANAEVLKYQIAGNKKHSEDLCKDLKNDM